MKKIFILIAVAGLSFGACTETEKPDVEVKKNPVETKKSDSKAEKDAPERIQENLIKDIDLSTPEKVLEEMDQQGEKIESATKELEDAVKALDEIIQN